MLLTITPFAAILQKLASRQISENPEANLTYFTGLVVVLVRMIILIFVWSPKGRYYGNQLNLGDVCTRRANDLYSLLWRSAMDWPIINWLSKGSMAIIQLHHVQIW